MASPKASPKKKRPFTTGVAGRSKAQVLALLKKAPVQTAADTIGILEHGVSMLGITKGQFSLLALIRAILDQTGPADLILSTWTFGIRDAEMAAWLLEAKTIRSLRFLVDRSFQGRSPRYLARLRELFGPECIVLSRVHAKFCTIRNDAWDLAVTSSMNLNDNPRWEHFTIDDCKIRCDLLDGVRRELELLVGTGWDVVDEQVESGFLAAMVDGDTMELVERYKKKLLKTEEKAALLDDIPVAGPSGSPVRVASPVREKPPPEPLPDPSSIEIPATLSGMLEAQYRLASVQEHGANQDHSWVAAGQFAALKVKLYSQLQAARKAEGAGALTEAQYFARLEDESGRLSTPHLEVFVREYLKRHPSLRLIGG